MGENMDTSNFESVWIGGIVAVLGLIPAGIVEGPAAAAGWFGVCVGGTLLTLGLERLGDGEFRKSDESPSSSTTSDTRS